MEAKIELQARKAFDNLKAVLAAAGCSLDDVVKTTVFSAIWRTLQRSTVSMPNTFPAKCFPPALPFRWRLFPKKATIEIEAIACKA